ncbi:MAG: hypothetical protein QOJ38_1488 [Solirubrobacterales bacterium]|jgi:uncharacterized protein YkwD|nr:hypothetical protein [Solirubrobacterales bacterium]
MTIVAVKLSARRAAAVLSLAALLALLAAMTVAGPDRAGANGCPGATAALGALSGDDLRSAVACLINQERRRSGLHQLKSSGRLFSAAKGHNADIQRKIHWLSHDSSNGDPMSTRLRKHGYMKGARSWAVGEVIGEAWGPAMTPRDILQGWLDSPPHNRVLHTARYREFGVAGKHGSADDPSADGALFTVDFGQRN